MWLGLSIAIDSHTFHFDFERIFVASDRNSHRAIHADTLTMLNHLSIEITQRVAIRQVTPVQATAASFSQLNKSSEPVAGRNQLRMCFSS
jgi:hypothetical protein